MNDLEFFTFAANQDFTEIGWYNKDKRHFLVFSSKYSQARSTISCMASHKVEDENDQGEIQFVRNQHLKSLIYCVHSSKQHGTLGYCFLANDRGKPKK